MTWAALILVFLALPALATASDDKPDKRPVPNYDGRSEEPTTAEDVLIWFPRVAMFPAYFVAESVVRKPLGTFVTYAERNHWPQTVIDFFTFGESRKGGFVPIFMVDFGFRPSGGVYVFWNDLGIPGNELRVRAAFGGESWILLSATERLSFDRDRGHSQLDVRWSRRPDHIFQGIGTRSDTKTEGRYQASEIESKIRVGYRLWRESRTKLDAEIKYAEFGPDGCCGRSVASLVDEAVLELPPGMARGFLIHRYSLSASLDTREPIPGSTSGVVLGARVGVAAEIRRPEDLLWMEYKGRIGGYVDLTGNARTLGLILETSMVDPLGASDVPFTELPTLGGSQPLPAFLGGALKGQSAASLTLTYRWPVWAFMDGVVDVGVGDVFDTWLNNFYVRRLRASAAIGLRPNDRFTDLFYFLVGVGTERFDQGAGVTSVRFLIGNTNVL